MISLSRLQDGSNSSIETSISSSEIDVVVETLSNELSVHSIQMAALGRHFHLGQLYNYVNDEIVLARDTPFKLQWERWGESLKYAALHNVQSELSIIRTDSKAKNKWDRMGLDEHLKASTLGGLINPRPNSYLENEIENTEVTRLVHLKVKSQSTKMNLHCWVNLWQIARDCNREYLLSFQQNVQTADVTHVVVGVNYGAEAFCVLVYDGKENGSLVEEQLSWIAIKIEEGLDGHKRLNYFKDQFDQKRIKQLERIKCRMYVDSMTPTFREYSVFDAYNKCLQVIEQAQKVESNVISVILCPVEILMGVLDEFKLPLKNRITVIDSRVYLLDRCCKMWSDLEILGVQVKILQDEANGDDHLTRFSKVLHGIMDRFKRKLKNGILVMRMGFRQFDFDNLLDLEDQHFIFGISSLKNWINLKKNEKEIEKKYANLRRIHFVPNKSQLERKLVRDTTMKTALVLSVASLQEQSSCILDVMEKQNTTYDNIALLTRKIYASSTEVDLEILKKRPWFLNNERMLKVKIAIAEMLDHARNNERNCRYYLTYNSELGDRDFRYSVHLPEKICFFNEFPKIEHLEFKKLKEKNKTNYFLITWKCKKTTGFPCRFLIETREGDSSSWKPRESSTENKVMLSCPRSRKFQVRVAVETCLGQGKFSEILTL